ncbi:MAG TPA: hypothetical protein DCL24_03525 [Erysipelotrichaceae bacterium]|nr:hypothetical protein [Erysipelotrichaceae bacterium]
MIYLGIAWIIIIIVFILSYRRLFLRIWGIRVPASIVGYQLLEENKHGDVYCFKVLYRHQGMIYKANSLETFTLPHGHYPFGHRNEYVEAYYHRRNPDQVMIASITYPQTYSLLLLLLAGVLGIIGLYHL